MLASIDWKSFRTAFGPVPPVNHPRFQTRSWVVCQDDDEESDDDGEEEEEKRDDDDDDFDDVDTGITEPIETLEDFDEDDFDDDFDDDFEEEWEDEIDDDVTGSELEADDDEPEDFDD